MTKPLARGVLASLLLLHSTISFAASGSTGAAFLQIPVGAGPAAMGSAYSALATDAYAPVWNPAGLGYVHQPEVAAQHLSYLEAIHYEFLSLALPVKEGRSVGFSAQYLGSGGIAGFDVQGLPQPSYSTEYGAYSVAYGQTIGSRLSLGLTGKFLQAKISDVSALAFSEDFGGLYKVDDKTTLAAVLSNAPWPLPWPHNKLQFLNDDSPLPLAFRLGGSYQAERRLMLSGEIEIPKGEAPNGRFGVEWKPLPPLALRAGYRTTNANELGVIAHFSVGMGLTLWGQEFSYAWVPYGDLGETQYFSFVFRWGANGGDAHNLTRGVTP